MKLISQDERNGAAIANQTLVLFLIVLKPNDFIYNPLGYWGGLPGLPKGVRKWMDIGYLNLCPYVQHNDGSRAPLW
jgi:hypothetical protein